MAGIEGEWLDEDQGALRAGGGEVIGRQTRGRGIRRNHTAEARWAQQLGGNGNAFGTCGAGVAQDIPRAEEGGRVGEEPDRAFVEREEKGRGWRFILVPDLGLRLGCGLSGAGMLAVSSSCSASPVAGGRRSGGELAGLDEAQAIRRFFQIMAEAQGGFPAQADHFFCVKFPRAVVGVGEGRVGKRIWLAAPVFDPVEVGRPGALTGDDDLGYQHRVVAEGRVNRLIDGEVLAGGLLTQVSHAEEALEGRARAGVVGAENLFAIGEVADARAEES